MPQSQHPSHRPATDDIAIETLKEAINRAVAAPPAPAPRPPASPVAPAPAGVWGPSAPRAISPLGLLVKVADETYRLQKKVEQLATAITGEQAPQHRLRDMPRAADGLLPAVAFLLHEIEAVHAEIAGLVEHIRGRLG